MSLVWTKTSAPSENMYWTCVASSSTGQNLAATASAVPASAGGIWRSTDYGVTWTQTGAPPAPGGGGWTRIASNAAGDKLVAAVYGGQIYTYDDTTTIWTAQTVAGITNSYWDGLASDSTGQYLVAIEHCVGIFNSSDYGINWTQPVNQYLIWSCVTSDSTGQNLAAATITSSIGGASQLWTTNGTGTGTPLPITWTPESSPTIPPVTFWCMASDSTGQHLAAGPGTSTVGPGAIYTSDTSGQTWFATASGNQRWTSIASDSTGANLAAATSSGIYITTNGTASPAANVTWTLSNNLNINWTSVASNSTGANLVAVTTGNGIYSTYTQLQPGAYVAYGTDLTNIFAAQSSLPLAAPTYYGQAGADLNTIYEANAGTYAAPTGFLVNGTDLNQIFED